MLNKEYAALKAEQPALTRRQLRTILAQFRKWRKKNPTASILEEIKNGEVKDDFDNRLKLPKGGKSAKRMDYKG
jgi:hypothetical protein